MFFRSGTAIIFLLSLLFASPRAAACERPDQAACPAASLELGYTGETWRNLRGGIESGDSYLDKLDLIMDLDASRGTGQNGLSAHAHVMYNNGREFGARYVGENQLVSNIEGVATWRLYEIWADYQFGRRTSNSIRFGL